VLLVVFYLLAILGLNLAWEIAQLPLYTIWTLAPNEEIAWAVVHCTLGDVLIAGSALAIGWFVTGSPKPSHGIPLRLVVVAVVLGLAITVFSEWRATRVTHAWAYSSWMPLLPWIGLGLTPILQWIVVPPIAMRLVFGVRWPRSGSTKRPA
jgi:hypothetical protein